MDKSVSTRIKAWGSFPKNAQCFKKPSPVGSPKAAGSHKAYGWRGFPYLSLESMPPKKPSSWPKIALPTYPNPSILVG